MKKYILQILIFSIFLIPVISWSQTYKEQDDVAEEDVYRQDIDALGILNSGKTENELNQIQGSSIKLQQVGEFNQATVLAKTSASDITLNQNGDFNKAGLFYNAKTAFADLKQLGDVNTILDIALDPSENISLELIQQGDGLYFERFGVNELTKSMKFRQTKASPTIIVRSFY